jgi:hypothetical protein
VSAAVLHPARQRRLAELMPPGPHHEVLLRPLGGGDARTIIVTSGARNFVEALFEDLAAPDWRARLAALRGARRDEDGLLKLSLPIHRKFQIALFEAACIQPGTPRLDPEKIESQGMVVRRHVARRWHGWMKRGKKVSGWLPLGLTDSDPDPVRRQDCHPANRSVRALLAQRRPPSTMAEETLPLFLAPPEVCEARARTILFGVIPVASDDRSDEPPPRLDYAALPADQRGEMVGHLSAFLKARPPVDLPRAGQPLARDWNILSHPVSPPSDFGQLQSLGLFLQQMLVELDCLGDGAAPKALMALMRQIRLPAEPDQWGNATSSVDAAAFVAKAGPILIGGEGNPHGFRMPLEWPRIEPAFGARLELAALRCLSDRHASLASSPGKYESADDQFAVRAFIRVHGPEGCPDTLAWSVPSERFRIASWWDGDGPGTKIVLPDLSQLGKVKPNVSFEMPPGIANLLQKDLKKMGEGEGHEDWLKGLQVGWLCSFSIPIITLCAFIVLNIFLSLFDIIFRWKMFLKICIPIPKKGS